MFIAALIFPHQLFSEHPALNGPVKKVVLVEDTLFFGDAQYPVHFHKQKLAFHRATMAHYASELEARGIDVSIETYTKSGNMLPKLCKTLAASGIQEIRVAELNDFLLSQRLHAAAVEHSLTLNELGSPAFLNTHTENREWRLTRKRWFMADFYQWQRKRLNILIDDAGPVGGQWSFDDDNRKKLPKGEVELLPELPLIRRTDEIESAIASVLNDFPNNPGSVERWHYPISGKAATLWLEAFLDERFVKFGPYEDAMAAGHNWIYHSVLTPMLNVGLLTPQQVVTRALTKAEEHAVPINSLEGFVRQIIGWREFMRATYDDLGVAMRTTNHWQHQRAIPASFYDGTTGIDPVDDVIKRVLETGYCHHIERLMILGGFMFLCEFDPDEIYRWFMELFIDSYDWVMVPNVYAMSQHADGGAITTKPYFSGSNYILKMSNYKKGEWSVIWDGLFWRWIVKNSQALKGNPRWAMMVRNAEKMDNGKRAEHLGVAETFLGSLGSQPGT